MIFKGWIVFMNTLCFAAPLKLLPDGTIQILLLFY